MVPRLLVDKTRQGSEATMMDEIGEGRSSSNTGSSY